MAKAVDKAYQTVRERIVRGVYPASSRITEQEVAAVAGVSRTPVREALFRLRNEGFLDVESKAGWFVKPIDFGKLDQLYDLRVVLELDAIAKLVARREDPPALDALKAVWLVPAPTSMS